MVILFDGNSEIDARYEQSLLFDLYKVFDLIESSHKSEFSLRVQHVLRYHLI